MVRKIKAQQILQLRNQGLSRRARGSGTFDRVSKSEAPSRPTAGKSAFWWRVSVSVREDSKENSCGRLSLNNTGLTGVLLD